MVFVRDAGALMFSLIWGLCGMCLNLNEVEQRHFGHANIHDYKLHSFGVLLSDETRFFLVKNVL